MSVDGATASNLKVFDLEKLRESLLLLHKVAPEPRFDTLVAGPRFRRMPLESVVDAMPESTRSHMLGYQVLEVPLPPRRPVLQISPDFEYCSPEFRAVWNAWALDRFGTEEVCYLMSSRAMGQLMSGRIDEEIARQICQMRIWTE